MKRLLLLLLPSLALAQIDVPRLGVFLDAQGRLRPLFGLPGALLSGPPAADKVLSAAASDTHVVWKTEEQLCIQENGRPAECEPAPPGPALFAFHLDGRPAVQDFISDSSVVALSVRYRVEDRGGALFRVAAADRAELPLPGLAAPALVFDDGSVIAVSGDSLVLRAATGEDRLLLDQPVSRLHLLNRDLVLLDGARILRLRDGALFSLPREEGQP